MPTFVRTGTPIARVGPRTPAMLGGMGINGHKVIIFLLIYYSVLLFYFLFFFF